MSSRVSVQACTFIDHHVGGTQETYYGYRIYDDHGQDYRNYYGSIEEVLEDIKEETILDFLDENHEEFAESVRWKGGLYLNGDWIDVCEPECPTY